MGLEKFEMVVLDFKGVQMVGQGFADEVFRVWQKNWPSTLKAAMTIFYSWFNMSFQRFDWNSVKNQKYKPARL